MYEIHPLHENKKAGNLLIPISASLSEEAVSRSYDLWLRDYLVKDEKDSNKFYHRYRLMANHPHNIEMALAYDIKCPRCGNMLRQVGRCLNSNELGEYACSSCDNRR